MNYKPEISVIIPVYNVEKYLQACIDSLVVQTYKKAEYIFVNDASPDNSLQILRENQNKYPDRIRIIDSTNNLKQGGARNLGIKAAKGEWIAFCDSDDMVSADWLETMYDNAIRNNADASFIQMTSVEENELCNANRGGYSPLIIWNKKLKKISGSKLSDDERQYLIAYPFGGIYCGLWRKRIILENGILFPEHLRYEDNYWSTVIRVYLTKVVFTEKVCYFYRKNPTSTVNSQNAVYHKDRIVIENQMLNFFKTNKLLDKYYESVEYLYAQRYYLNTYDIMTLRYDTIQKETIKKIHEDLKSNFPHWRKNCYYIESHSTKGKSIDFLKWKFPIAFAYIFKAIIEKRTAEKQRKE